MSRSLGIAAVALLSAVATSWASDEYDGDSDGFYLAITGLQITVIDFSTLEVDELLADQYTFDGLHFFSSDNATVTASNTASGSSINSPPCILVDPGGDTENEYSWTVVFDVPVRAVGFDHFDDSLDGDPPHLQAVVSYTDGSQPETFDLSAAGEDVTVQPFGLFWGVVSDERNIGAIQLNHRSHGGPDVWAFDDFVFPDPPPVPAVSSWGLAAMTLLVLTAGTLVFARRRREGCHDHPVLWPRHHRDDVRHAMEGFPDGLVVFTQRGAKVGCDAPLD